jgi:hypothetical protein
VPGARFGGVESKAACARIQPRIRWPRRPHATLILHPADPGSLYRHGRLRGFVRRRDGDVSPSSTRCRRSGTIVIGGYAEVTLVQGAAETLTVEAARSQLRRFKVSVRDGTLTILTNQVPAGLFFFLRARCQVAAHDDRLPHASTGSPPTAQSRFVPKR